MNSSKPGGDDRAKRRGEASSRRWRGPALVVLAIICGLGVRAGLVRERGQAYSHDDIISVLVATGNQGRLGDAEKALTVPHGRWTSAAEWRTFVEMRPEATAADVASGLARYDIHPPLYFWLLRSAIAVLGVHAWTGAALNALIFIATALMLYRLGRAIDLRPPLAALSAALWAVSPAVVFPSLAIRQYDLLALWTVLAVLLVVQTAREDKPGRSPMPVALAGTAAAGLLTHYYFAIVIAALAGAFLLTLWRRGDGRTLAHLIAATAGGIALALVVFPQMIDVISSFGGAGEGLSLAALGGRLAQIVKTLGMFVTLSHRLATLICGVAIVAVVVTLVAPPLRRRFAACGEKMRRGESFVLVAGGVLMFAWIALFLAFVTPGHAFSIRHLSPLWPFMALGLVILGQHCLSQQLRTGLYALPLFFILTIGVTIARGHGPFTPVADPAALGNAGRVVMDSTARGHVLRIALRVPPNAEIYSSTADDLLSDPGLWLNDLTDGDIYASSVSLSGTFDRRRKILSILSRRFRLEPVRGGPDAALGVWILHGPAETVTGRVGTRQSHGAAVPA